ncbi:MAG: sulfurtransferase-like selenium metabolism protein YedF [Spirochaetes bacterium]|nr:sulfurtransferase-like selenium metabolism protein YedF [Spirochaetota bacterium]
MKQVDARGLECPKPVLLTKAEIEKSNPDNLIVLVSNETAVGNVTRFAENSGYSVTTTRQDDYFLLQLHKSILKEQTLSFPQTEKTDTVTENTVFFFTSNEFGQGPKELSELLIHSFINTINETNMLPSTMIFVNSGIFLTTEGSKVLPALQEIEKKGVQIINCGTCLDFYKRKETLKVGIISNMYTIIEILMKATKVIRF